MTKPMRIANGIANSGYSSQLSMRLKRDNQEERRAAAGANQLARSSRAFPHGNEQHHEGSEAHDPEVPRDAECARGSRFDGAAVIPRGSWRSATRCRDPWAPAR